MFPTPHCTILRFHHKQIHLNCVSRLKPNHLHSLSFSNPTPEGENWPLYTKDNPIYYTFNAEGDEKQVKENLGKGPMSTACAFWNDFLPRLRAWTGNKYTEFDYYMVCVGYEANDNDHNGWLPFSYKTDSVG